MQAIAATVVFILTFLIWIPGHSRVSIMRIMSDKARKAEKELDTPLMDEEESLPLPESKESKEFQKDLSSPDRVIESSGEIDDVKEKDEKI